METLAPEADLADATSDAYSAEALGRLWASTYMFAQGSASIQHDIVSLLYRKFLPPVVREDYERLEQSFDAARPLVKRKVNSAAHSRYTDLAQGSVDTNFQSDVTGIIRDGHDTPTLDALLEKILKRDGRYLPEFGNDVPRTYGSGRGQYYSHAIKYILLGAQTPHPSLDHLFAEIRPSFVVLAEKKLSTSITAQGRDGYPEGVAKDFTLEKVIAIHVANNDGDLEPVQAALTELGIDNISV